MFFSTKWSGVSQAASFMTGGASSAAAAPPCAVRCPSTPPRDAHKPHDVRQDDPHKMRRQRRQIRELNRTTRSKKKGSMPRLLRPQ